MNKKISIITVVYNDDKGLLKTVNSVRIQNFKEIEFIVIDGNSSDNTLSVIMNNLDIITKYVSEPDKGIYDAMNKGIDLASGDFAIFLNAGDVFYSQDTLSDCVKYISNPNAVYFGRAENNSEVGNWLFPPIKINKSNVLTWLKKNVPNHQAMFFPRDYYKSNYYDLSLKISGDADYKWRALKLEKLEFIFVDKIVSIFDMGGVSTTYESFKKFKLRINNTWIVGNRYHSIFFVLKSQFKLFLKFFLAKVLNQKFLNKVIRLKY
jgi:putative colanic acid biosynthesis glycosyltransferase